MSPGYCTLCGGALAASRPAGEDRDRLVCAVCAQVHYENPVVHVGCVALDARSGETVLRLARLEPREKIQAGALRAIGQAGLPAPAPAEEALALYCALTDLAADAVYLVFRVARPQGALPRVGSDEEPAWAPDLVGRYADDARAALFPVYTGSIDGERIVMSAVPRDSPALG